MIPIAYPAELMLALVALHVAAPTGFVDICAAFWTGLCGQQFVEFIRHPMQIALAVYVKLCRTELRTLQRIFPSRATLFALKRRRAFDFVSAIVDIDEAREVAVLVWTTSHIFTLD